MLAAAAPWLLKATPEQPAGQLGLQFFGTCMHAPTAPAPAAAAAAAAPTSPVEAVAVNSTPPPRNTAAMQCQVQVQASNELAAMCDSPTFAEICREAEGATAPAVGSDGVQRYPRPAPKTINMQPYGLTAEHFCPDKGVPTPDFHKLLAKVLCTHPPGTSLYQPPNLAPQFAPRLGKDLTGKHQTAADPATEVWPTHIGHTLYGSHMPSKKNPLNPLTKFDWAVVYVCGRPGPGRPSKPDVKGPICGAVMVVGHKAGEAAQLHTEYYGSCQHLGSCTSVSCPAGCGKRVAATSCQLCKQCCRTIKGGRAPEASSHLTALAQACKCTSHKVVRGAGQQLQAPLPMSLLFMQVPQPELAEGRASVTGTTAMDAVTDSQPQAGFMSLLGVGTGAAVVAAAGSGRRAREPPALLSPSVLSPDRKRQAAGQRAVSTATPPKFSMGAGPSGVTTTARVADTAGLQEPLVTGMGRGVGPGDMQLGQWLGPRCAGCC